MSTTLLRILHNGAQDLTVTHAQVFPEGEQVTGSLPCCTHRDDS